MKLNTLTDSELLKSLRELREVTESGKQNYSAEIEEINSEIEHRIVVYLRSACQSATESIVGGFIASATWHQDSDAWPEDGVSIQNAAYEYAHRELQNYLDQEVETEIKATGSGRPDTMSRVINPPDNGL
jgi:hypothetical protein